MYSLKNQKARNIYTKCGKIVVVHVSKYISRSSSVVEPDRFGPGFGKILLDEMACSGNESDISDCPRNEWGESDCGHTEDVGVSCRKIVFYLSNALLIVFII